MGFRLDVGLCRFDGGVNDRLEGHDLPPVDAVGEVAGRQRQDERRKELREPDVAEVERPPREVVHLPAHGDGNDLSADHPGEPRGLI